MEMAQDIKDRVIFVGNAPHDMMPLYDSAADIFAFPTRADGIPNVVSEAMRCGAAIVCTDLQSVHEILENGKNCFLFESDNESDLRDKLEQLLKNPKLINEFSRAGVNTLIDRKLTWPENARKHITVYENLLKNG